MPWTTDNPPDVAKNWTAAERRRCVLAANATLRAGKSDEEAIFACIAAAGKSKRKRGDRMNDFMDKLAERVLTRLGLGDGSWTTTTTGDFAGPTMTDVHQPGAMGDRSAGSRQGGRLSKAEANYREADGPRACPACASKAAKGCQIVDGGGQEGYTCDRWSAAGEREQTEESAVFFVRFEKAADDVLIFPIGPFKRDGRDRQFTREQAQEMVAHFKANVIGRLPPVNREHKREHGRVARITDLWLADDGVRGKVEEVDGYEGALKAFDYLSPEVRWAWTHPQTGKEYKNVLFGAAATNYPFFLAQMALHGEHDGGRSSRPGRDVVPFAKSEGPECYVWDGGQWEVYEEMAEMEDKRKAQEARARRYGIGVKAGGALTPPKGFPTSEGEYGDPVNYRYPADAEHARPALGYFNQSDNREKGGYSGSEWAVIGRRLARLISRHMPASYEYKNGRLQRKDEEGAESEPEPFVHEIPFLAADQAQRIVYGVVLQPDTPDSQGHVVSAAEVEAACHRFNERMQEPLRQAQGGALDAHHARLVQADEARVVESWVQREPTAWTFFAGSLEDGESVVEVAPGSWCMAVKVYDDGLWSEVLSGEITGLSPRGRAVARRV